MTGINVLNNIDSSELGDGVVNAGQVCIMRIGAVLIAQVRHQVGKGVGLNNCDDANGRVL